MDYFINIYKKRCKEEFSKYGFKSFRNNYYRVVNDIFQSFTLHRSVSGSDCNTIFGIVPLSVEYKLDKSFVNPCRVSDFEDNRPWYNYDRTLESSVEKCINDMILTQWDGSTVLIKQEYKTAQQNRPSVFEWI